MKQLVSLLCGAAFLMCFFVSPSNARLFEVSGGVSKTFNARWTESLFSMNEYLSYNMDSTEFTMIEGKICNTKTGLALGANMNLDNNAVGKANSIAGYIGFDRLYARFHGGNFNGIAQWDGKLGPGQTRLTKFEGSVTHIDLVYWRKKFPMYFGIGYTSYAVPMEIMTTYTNTDKVDQRKAVYFYDPDYKATYYSFVFGIDTFTSSLLYYDSKDMSEGQKLMAGADKNPWGFFVVAQDRFGFGSDQISAKAMTAARTLNPGLKPVASSLFSTYIENTSSMGLRWRGVTPYGRIAVGIGYELAFNFVIDPVGGAAEKKGDLGIFVNSTLARYGPIARVYVQF